MADSIQVVRRHSTRANMPGARESAAGIQNPVGRPPRCFRGSALRSGFSEEGASKFEGRHATGPVAASRRSWHDDAPEGTG